jgi:DhnA family fructose-bisphosphate aldolase class Ia
MAEEVRSQAVDVMLTSASNGERLSLDGVFDDSPVTLAVRANDTTDIWNQRGGRYPALPSKPFRTANLAQVREFCSLVLYSVTFNNDLDHDLATLEAFAAFRADAHAVGIRYFLEVFNPNAPVDLDPADVGAFVNDHIIRTLAGVTLAERPLFLKMAYNGSQALRELVEHDPSLVVGILGGSAGTARDTFELLTQAEQNGARVALFGRKVQRSESQLDLLAAMRSALRREVTPEQAVAGR